MTTTTKTTSDLATAVMRKLGMIDPNKTPSAAEQSMIIDLYYDKMEELRAKELVYWSESAIPRAVFGAMVRIIAEEFAPALGADVPTEQDESGAVVSIGNMGLRMLRRQMARDATGLPTKANYF